MPQALYLESDYNWFADRRWLIGWLMLDFFPFRNWRFEINSLVQSAKEK